MNRSLLSTRTVTQVGILVHDIQKTAQKYADFLGVDLPNIIETDVYEKARTEYQGTPSKAQAKLAFFNIGSNLQLELIEPDHEPSTWRQYLDEHGEGMHHLALVIKGMSEKTASMAENGMPLIQKGEYQGGRYAYIDATRDLKVILELLEND